MAVRKREFTPESGNVDTYAPSGKGRTTGQDDEGYKDGKVTTDEENMEGVLQGTDE